MKSEFVFFRHGPSNYRTLENKRKNDPMGKVKPADQEYPDLTEEGRKSVAEKAQNFLQSLDPKNDPLILFSSSEARAIETADIFLKEALSRGFKIVEHTKVGEGLSRSVGDGYIRTLKTLTPRVDNVLVHSLFNSESMLGDLNWDKVDPAFKGKWRKARAIIEESVKKGEHDDTWRENFLHHAEELKQYFPEIASAKDRFDTLFQNMLRLIRFASRKGNPDDHQNKITVLGFGHEDMVLFALQKYFNVDEIENGDHVNFVEDGDGSIHMYWKENNAVKV